MTGFYIIILLFLKFQQRIFSLRYKIFRKIKLTCTSCFVLCNSWCQSVFTVSKFLCIPIFFPMFIRLLLNRDRSSLYLHKASWIWNWSDLLFCCKSTKLKKCRVLNAPLASYCNTAKIATPQNFLRHSKWCEKHFDWKMIQLTIRKKMKKMIEIRSSWKI